MKKILLFIVLLQALPVTANINSDSLYAVIQSNTYSDSLKLEAYEQITIYLKNTDLDSCRNVCYEALNFSKKAGNKLFEFSFLTRIGITYLYAAKYDETAEYWTEALRIGEETDSAYIISQCLNNLGILFQSMKEYDKALDYYKRALEYKIMLLDTVAATMIEMNIGMTYLDAYRLKEASDMFNDLLPKIETLKNQRKRYSLYANIAANYAKLATNPDILESQYGITESTFDKEKYLNLALNYYFLAKKEIDNTDNVIDKISLYLNIGDTYLFLGDTANGFYYLNTSMKQAQENNAINKKRLIYQVLHNYYYNSQNYKMAYYYKDSMQIISDTINDIDKKTAIAEIQTKYESEKKENENLQLRRQVDEEEFKNLKQRRINIILLLIFIVVLVLAVVVSYFLYRVRVINHQLLKSTKALQEANESLQLSKEETEKALEFKSMFLANMSHEIRTPLNIILGFNSILRKSITDPELIKYVDSIKLSSYNLLKFLNDILDMSKIEAGKLSQEPDNINIITLIDDIRDLFKIIAEEKQLKLIVEVDKNVPHYVFLDEIRLRQILVNIIGNALKFTDQGYVKVTVDAPVKNKLHFELSSKTNIRIQIEDTGIGISAEDQKQIFEAFRQVNHHEHKELGGSGLGLAISQRLTAIMNGEISVESQTGKGSKFTVLFKNVPLGHDTSLANSHKIKLSEDLEYEFTGGTILIADDEDMNRSLIEVCFQKTMVTVLEANNGKITIEMAKQHKPDLILMDVTMPVVDGVEASRIIKSDPELNQIPIIAFSASNIFDTLSKEDADLFSDLLSKPIVVEELYEKVAKIIPHKIKTEPQKMQPDNESVSVIIKEDLLKITPQMADRLTGEFSKKWSEVHGSNSMNKIIEFIKELNIWATENNLTGLQSYSNKILESGKSFDIDRVKKLMKQFPEIVHFLRS